MTVETEAAERIMRDIYELKIPKEITVFHDIYAHEYDKLNGGTVRLWKEVCELNQGKLMRTFLYTLINGWELEAQADNKCGGL